MISLYRGTRELVYIELSVAISIENLSLFHDIYDILQL